MRIEQAIEILKKRVKKVYNKSRCQVSKRIYRGHSANMSAAIENEIALFLQNILPKNYEFYIDPSIKIDKTHRPDILIIDNKKIDNKKNVKAIIELKSNIGYCRNAKEVLSKLKSIHNIFIKKKDLTCSFSLKDESDKSITKKISYPKNTKCFFVIYTGRNCPEKYHKNNREIAKKKDLKYFILFNEGYGNPQKYEIEQFANEIKQVCK